MLEHKVADNIKYFRDIRNWTQEQLAEKLNVSRSVVAKWENGSTLPDLKALVAISDVFNISIDHLVGRIKVPKEILKEFQLIYSADQDEFRLDSELIEILDFIIKNPSFKDDMFHFTTLPRRKQKFIKQLISEMISSIEKV